MKGNQGTVFLVQSQPEAAGLDMLHKPASPDRGLKIRLSARPRKFAIARFVKPFSAAPGDSSNEQKRLIASRSRVTE